MIQRIYAWACERLYHEFAWGYDIVSWIVSAGRWDAWRGAALEHVRGPRVLELGFGTGELLVQLSRRNLEVHGVDLSPQMHGVASAKIQQMQAHDTHDLANLAQPHLTLANAQALPYPDGYFQTIVSTFPAPYILDPRTLDECFRVLAPTPSSPSSSSSSSSPSSPPVPVPGRLIIVGMWVSPRSSKGSSKWSSKWLQHFPVFFGSPSEADIQALAEPFRAAGLEPTFETFIDRWADVSVIIAQRTP